MTSPHAVNDTASGRFVQGNSGYRLRKAARDLIRDGLLAEYDFASPAASVLLPIIVGHLFDAERARKRVDRVRAANAANRLLRSIPRRDAAPPPPLSSYRERIDV
jgi:hypothetical protein